MSFNKDADATKIFLTSTQGSATVTRLDFTPGNRIIAYGTQVGMYQANTPFRVRKYVDMDSKTYSVVIDDEMNGFDDDLVYTDIPFTNSGITSINRVQASLVAYTNPDVISEDRIAYDDIVVKIIL